MAHTLQQLSDLEDIRTVKHRYFRGIDTADMALLETLFCDDLVVDYRGGTYRVRLTGKADMLEFLANAFHSDALAMHHGHMPDIALTGDNSATGLWYLEDIFIDRKARTHTPSVRRSTPTFTGAKAGCGRSPGPSTTGLSK
jgi:hypothetical protein